MSNIKAGGTSVATKSLIQTPLGGTPPVTPLGFFSMLQLQFGGAGSA